MTTPSSSGMHVRDVLAVLAVLEAAGCRVWLEGGWGVDALVGHQTRPHRDVDVDIGAECEEAAFIALAELGYVVETDLRPNRVELAAPGRGWLDMHPLLLAEDGSARQAALDGGFHVFPAAFFTVGSLDGVPVPASLLMPSDSFTGGMTPGPRISTTSICSRGSNRTTAVLV